MSNTIHLTGYLDTIQSLTGGITYPQNLEGDLHSVNGEIIDASALNIYTQIKTIKPSIYQQTVFPDEGFNYLSEIILEPIPYTETPNKFDGLTVRIG